MSTSVLSVRITDHERSLLEVAAKEAHTNLSDYVRRQALEAAELDVLQRGAVTIPHDDWERFEAWLHRPAESNPSLEKTLNMKPVWE